MKVLLSAFSCCPGLGSEPGVGWNWLLQISRRHEVWLLTSEEFQSQIEEQLPANVHATFIPSASTWKRLHQLPVPGLPWLYYYWWQWKAYRAARRLHAKVNFHLAHHVTFVAWRAPSFLCLLPIPFIWGPVGGGGTPPKSMAPALGGAGRLAEGFRAVCQYLPQLDPGVRLTMKRASVIFANIQETANLVPRAFSGKVRIFFGVGLNLPEAPKHEDLLSAESVFTVLFAAQLLPIKGGRLVLKAFAVFNREQPDSRLVILGEGPERKSLEDLAAELRISGKVEFPGWLAPAQVALWMQKAAVLVHPSLRDSGGMVLLEAMVNEKPVICLNLGGPAHIVTPECGFKIHPSTPDEVVAGLAGALEKLAKDPALCRAMGQAGRRRVAEQFDWERRGDHMLEVYREFEGDNR